jgi:hypothetical protein
MPEATFSVTYDGPALTAGRMAVRDLAPALLALGELVTEASETLYPDQAPASLSISATKPGSFDVQLILQGKEGVWDQLVELFGSDAVSAIVNLKEVIAGGAGIFWLIKRLGSRRIRAEEPTPGPGRVRLTLDDGSTVEVSSDVVKTYRNVRVRKRARTVVEPIKRSGIDRVEFRDDREVTVSVDEDDTAAFETEEDETPLLEEESELVVSIESVAFREGNKWRLSDGERTFYAAIEDDEFVARVERGVEAFRSGDFLRCRMKVVQTATEGELRTEYHVLRVEKHISAGEQLPLESGEDGPEASASGESRTPR